MDELVALTRELVAIPSHEDETAAGDAIENWLRRETDAAVSRDAAGNVIARRGDGEASLALVGHHDVVPPDDRQTKDGTYVVEQRDGRLYGRGAADMKGAVAAAMLAVRDCDPASELVFASFAGEEVGGEGCRAAIEAGFAPDYVVVGEGSTGYSAPGVTDVAVAHKGRRGSTIVAEGVASHASEPEAGENAIYRACDAVDRLRGLPTPTVVVAGESLSGSVVATEVAGGEAMNVVPDRCAVTVDERTVPGDRAPLERLETVDGVSVQVDQDLPPMRCDDARFREAVLDAAREVQDDPAGEGGRPAAVVKPHATDAGWLARAGVEPVVCGPAEPGEAHTATESVSVAVLERCYRIYRTVAKRVSG
jgi:acetylornithine deacetylase